VLVAQLSGLIEDDREFAEELRRAVRNAEGSASAHNVIAGNFSGRAVRSGSIGLGGLILIIAVVLGIGVTVTVFVTNLLDSDTTTGGTPENPTEFNGARLHPTE
jgi:hypothetical protein